MKKRLNLLQKVNSLEEISDDVEVFYCHRGSSERFLKEARTKLKLFLRRTNRVHLGVDIETTQKFGGQYKGEGLSPYLSEMVMIQLALVEAKQVIILDWRYWSVRDLFLIPLSEALASKNIRKVGHNLAFEWQHFIHHLGVDMINMWDTMIAEQIIHCGMLDHKLKMGLSAVTNRYLGFELPKEVREEFLTIKSKPFTEEQVEYGVRDALIPVHILQYQDQTMFELDLKKVMTLEMLFLPCISYTSYRGMHFSKERWLEIYGKNKEKLDEIVQKLNDEVIRINDEMVPLPNHVSNQTDIFGNTKTCLINWNSPKQVIEFFDLLGMHMENDQGKKSVDAKVVKAYLQKFSKTLLYKDLLFTYISYKEIVKSCSTYGQDFLKYVNPVSGRIHSSYKQILNTGRISSSNPNLQNIPRGSHREAFTAPDNGKIINADYSGQEQIVLANKSLEPGLLEFYRSGETDMHSFICSKLYPKETTGLDLATIKKTLPHLRHTAKIAGFSINYGGNGFTIAKNLGIDPEIGDRVYNAYFKAFPKLKEYFDKVQKDALLKLYILVDEHTNRKSFFKDPETIKNSLQKKREINKIKRAALNYPIQGEAGSITKLAAIYFYEWTKAMNISRKVFISNIVHDEINVEYNDNYAASKQDVAEQLELCMKKAGDLWCKEIPLSAEAQIVDYWTH